jgi:hypothetical protein
MAYRISASSAVALSIRCSGVLDERSMDTKSVSLYSKEDEFMDTH